MKRYHWLAGFVVLFAGFGCGDDSSSGGGGANGGSDQGGTPSSGGAPSGGAPEGGAPEGGAPEGGAPEGGAPEGGAPATGGGGSGQGGGLALYEDCTENDMCESGICHTFNGQGVTICTKDCESPADCPAPSPGCNGMNLCMPP